MHRFLPQPLCGISFCLFSLSARKRAISQRCRQWHFDSEEPLWMSLLTDCMSVTTLTYTQQLLCGAIKYHYFLFLLLEKVLTHTANRKLLKINPCDKCLILMNAAAYSMQIRITFQCFNYYSWERHWWGFLTQAGVHLTAYLVHLWYTAAIFPMGVI